MSITLDRLYIGESLPATSSNGTTVTVDAVCPEGSIVLSGGCHFNSSNSTSRRFGPKEFPDNRWGYFCAASGTVANPVIITTTVLCLDTTP